MSLKHRLMPYIAQLITSDGLRNGRRVLSALTGVDRVAHFYFRADDPYSWLLAQQLPAFCERFPITIVPKVMPAVPQALYPEPQLYEQWALHDASTCAQLHGLEFPARAAIPSKDTVLKATRVLLSHEGQADFLDVANTVGRHIWEGHTAAIDALAAGSNIISENDAIAMAQQRQDGFLKEGHYLSGTLRVGAEWYWGPDRLDHLALRLAAKPHHQADALALGHWRQLQLLPNLHADGETLEFFFSFRSPYSYIALERTFRLSQHYRLDLKIRPVLPMVMRGLTVPTPKRMYILTDSKREAELAQVPFGKICDPVGVGVERCLALWPLAERQGKLESYLLNASIGIWSEGAHVAEDKDLEHIVTKSGLDWAEAKKAIKDEGWRERAEKNRVDMVAAGNWGVPAFRFRGEIFWGQDRISAVEQRVIALARQA